MEWWDRKRGMGGRDKMEYACPVSWVTSAMMSCPQESTVKQNQYCPENQCRFRHRASSNTNIGRLHTNTETCNISHSCCLLSEFKWEHTRKGNWRSSSCLFSVATFCPAEGVKERYSSVVFLFGLVTCACRVGLDENFLFLPVTFSAFILSQTAQKCSYRLSFFKLF